MDLTKECSYKTSQGKRIACETASCAEDVKRMKFISRMTSVTYDHMTDSKENMISEMPIDMSRHSKCGVTGVEPKTQSLDLSVRLLREKLRNEETALLLLRKLRRSQLSLAVRSGLAVVSSSMGQNHVSSSAPVTCQSNSDRLMLARQQFTNHVAPRNSLTASSQHAAVTCQQEVNRHVPAHSKIVPVNGTTTLKESIMRPQLTRPQAAVQPTNEQTLAQRKALAKLAIRRQLEATLLQLPMPKFTPQEMSFIPTIGFYADFVALVGMEEAVECILNEDATTEHAAEAEKLQPLQCARCHTDFTPQWKPEERGARSVICEQCAIKSHKEAFRQEHTARLKAAFYKALQQEQQIEIGGAVA